VIIESARTSESGKEFHEFEPVGKMLEFSKAHGIKLFSHLVHPIRREFKNGYQRYQKTCFLEHPQVAFSALNRIAAKNAPPLKTRLSYRNTSDKVGIWLIKFLLLYSPVAL